MAILNGNSDFNLSVTPGAQDKTIKIRFKRASSNSNNIRVVVSTPHVNVTSKTYNNTSDSAYTEWILPVSNYGDFKVHISTSSGYSYDFAIVKIRLSKTKSQSYKFTSADVTKWNAQGLGVNLMITGLGLTSLSWAIATGTVVSQLFGFYFATTNPKATMYDFKPRVGYSVRASYLSGGGNSVTYKLEYLDEEGDVKNTATKSVLIDTF